MATTKTKYFTHAEAEKTLPLVRKIVKDILDATREIHLLTDNLNGKIEEDTNVNKITS